MAHLIWKVVAPTWLKAGPIIDVDLADLCEGRCWGGSRFYMTIRFSIHKRKITKGPSDWQYQLIIPNGAHIYLNNVEEGKEIAEVIYARIMANLIAKPPISGKNKKAKLESLLRARKIDGRVYYSHKNPKGWMHLWTKEHDPQRLGYDYASAVALIEKGTMDFMARDSDFMKAKIR